MTSAAEEAMTERERFEKACDKVGTWLSAALEDEKVCPAMKADIREWFAARGAQERAAQICIGGTILGHDIQPAAKVAEDEMVAFFNWLDDECAIGTESFQDAETAVHFYRAAQARTAQGER